MRNRSVISDRHGFVLMCVNGNVRRQGKFFYSLRLLQHLQAVRLWCQQVPLLCQHQKKFLSKSEKYIISGGQETDTLICFHVYAATLGQQWRWVRCFFYIYIYNTYHLLNLLDKTVIQSAGSKPTVMCVCRLMLANVCMYAVYRSLFLHLCLWHTPT